MNSEDLYKLIGIQEGRDFGEMKAREFENLVSLELEKHGTVKRQVIVPNRGDGRRGRIDLTFKAHQVEYPIEIDRKSARQKSIFKVKSFDQNRAFIILRSPYKIIKV